jgi:GTP-binding protein
MSFTVAIIGRPNVGKSTLFNRLVGQRLALVDDTPGVTRDRREGQGRIADLSFRVFDTAGLEDLHDDSLEARMRRQTDRAVAEADVVLFLIDARAGVTPLDRHFAAWLRRGERPVVLVANKAEGKAGTGGLMEAFELGLGEPIALSAEHGEGLGDLYEALAAFAPSEADALEAPLPADETADTPHKMQIAVVGRPNVGKSTLINKLIGEDRLLTGPEAGITRDAIAIDWSWQGRPFRVFDTAGMRRRPRVEGKLEKLSVADTLRAIRFAEIVILVLDALQPFERQDLTIARMVEEEGRGLVLVAGKWDAVTDKQKALRHIGDRLQTSLPQLQGISLVPVSGKTGAGLDKLMQAVVATHETWNRRIPTPQLNRWLADVQERHPPPLVDGRRLRLRYMTQANIRPPTFALFASKPGDLPDAYRRYLVNLMRSQFDLPGVPVRMMLRKGKNPFAEKE